MSVNCAAEKCVMKGVDCVRLVCGRYMAVVSSKFGSSVWRMYDSETNMEIFRYSEDCTAKQIDKAREIWGLPTLYLPNRFDGGLLKTSDGEYHLPVNETKLGNHLHGWVHKREHTVERMEADSERAVLVTSFTHSEADKMYACFPLDFKITYTFELSEDGLTHRVKLENLSDKRLPVSICTHTCINAPLTHGSKQTKLRLSVPIEQRCELDKRCLPTERLLPLETKDLRYKNGSMRPTLHMISNDMYTACDNTLDGKPFYGVIITDKASGHRLCNEVSREYKFWNMWNDRGYNGYFCPEPMTAMINCTNLKLKDEITGYKELKKGEGFECWQRFFTVKS
ncbi:MAG: aldose 1-epimerase [Ruminococcus sp.]|nr:aldose 1-epimerase [Ruminococcus sp.]